MMKFVLLVIALAFVSVQADAFTPRSLTRLGNQQSVAANKGAAFTQPQPHQPQQQQQQLLSSSTQKALTVSGGVSSSVKRVRSRKQASAAAAAESKSSSGLMETLTVGTYFALWYLFNIAYNIYNKQSLNALAYPWTIATIQMAAGIFYFAPLWLLGIRKAPKLSGADLKTLFPIALCHTGVHVGAVIALGAGAVSFAHIVKASEPVVTCALNAILLGQILPVSVYMTLLPIISGVAIASVKELSFTFLALGAAMLSNVSSAARGVLSKKTMSGKKIGENLDAQNLYAVLTAMSTLILIPLMLGIEGTGMFSAFTKLVDGGKFTTQALSIMIALSGASYYAYNEVAFLALGKVNPVTHAVGNTIKRVVIIVASVVAFKTPMSRGSVIGSTVAILGTLMYSLAMNAAKSKK